VKPVDLALIAAAAESAGHAVEWEYRFHPTRKWRFDLAVPARKVAFEREGGTWVRGAHNRGKHYESDCTKYNSAAILGWLVIRGTVDMIESGLALTQFLEALEVRR
jgi:hypothetical protein